MLEKKKQKSENIKVVTHVLVFVAFCAECLTDDHRSLSADTLYFMAALNQTLSCFEKYQQVGSF